MEFISERIGYVKQNDELTVYIKSSEKNDLKKLNLMRIWVVLWFVCGLIIASQIFFDYNRETKLFIVVYLAFWAYFAYRAAYGYYFKKYGIETLHIQNKQVMVRKDILTRKGKPLYLRFDGKNPFHPVEEQNSFTKAYYASFWVVNGGTIAIGKPPKEYRFGVHLKSDEQNKLIRLLNQHAK